MWAYRASSCRVFVLALVAFVVLLQGSYSAPPMVAQRPSAAPPAQAPQPAPVPPSPTPSNPLSEALRAGKYPAQAAGPLGSIRPDRYGPQRTDPAEGIPAHAYSPFDERANREYPCPPGGCEFMKGQVLVKLTPQIKPRTLGLGGAPTESAALNEALAAQGVQRLEPLFPKAVAPKLGAWVESPQGKRVPMPDLTRWQRAVLADEQADVLAVAQALGAAPGVAYAEPDYLRKPETSPLTPLPLAERGTTSPLQDIGEGPGVRSVPTDPLYAQQWHLAAAHIPEAWAYLESLGLPPGGSRDIVVAVIDTGVDYTHPDLAANMWVNSREIAGNGVDDDGNGYVDDVHGADTVTPDGDPQDDHGHGTHVAGIIAAQANNGRGGVGVAYNVQIMAVKAAQYSGVLAASDIAEGIYYAVAQGADVINMSFGGYARSQVEEDALTVAFGQAVLVAAAGNDGKVNLPCPFGRDMYPAAYNWVLGVMASKQSNSGPSGWRASFSNYDCIPHDTHEYELMAPGMDVWSTLPNDQYAAWDGTSMAAPVVAGIAALARTKWADKDVYSSRFIMGQIAANAAGGTGGVADAHAALSVAPKPELRYLQHWLFDTAAQSAANDDDGIVDAGETVDLAIVVRNHWGKADPVTVTLEAWAEGAFQPDPYVTMISSTVDYGAIGSYNWDDNGLIYDSGGAITGVRSPFRFTVPITTPNDHVIPFLLTMTCRNGLDPADAATYTCQSRFYLVVQRGRELPRIIDTDMTLTAEHFWILPRLTRIEAGAAVTITDGTQVLFTRSDPNCIYCTSTYGSLAVRGSLFVQGTNDKPVELFSADCPESEIYTLGTTTLHYASLRDLNLGYQLGQGAVNAVDHCYLSGTGGVVVKGAITRSRADKLHHAEDLLELGSVDTVLFDAVWRSSGLYNHLGPMTNSVFLQDNVNHYAFRWGLQDLPRFSTASEAESYTEYRQNAFLSAYWDPQRGHWMTVASAAEGGYQGLTRNYWGTNETVLIDAVVLNDPSYRWEPVVYQPILTVPATTTYPFVVDVALSTAALARTSIVGAEPVTFTVTFNRDMDPTVQPQVSFGPDVPLTDYTIHPISGGWQDARTWAGTFNITPITGDGYQLIRVAGARAADDPWLVTGDDAGRFRFEVITSGTEAMSLQGTGGEGYVDLAWTQNDFDLLAGYNLYRATASGGPFSRVNGSIIPPQQKQLRDTNVAPGQPYYYQFTVVKSDMSESNPSNVAQATPLDTIAPVISHTPLTEAEPGLPLTLYADVTDNVGVRGVALFFRTIGATSYLSRAMTHTTGNRYSATIEGSHLLPPGIEYYLEASDGVTTVRYGRPEYPYQVMVADRPAVTAVSPLRGPVSGGTIITISGANFKPGATVTIGSAAANNTRLISASQITCTTPAHYPAAVDVIVINPGGQSGSLLRGYTYEADTASLSLPHTGGERYALVQVPLNAADVHGLAAADLTLSFDSTVLAARAARTGTLTPGWSLAANTSTPGQVRLSMASPGGTSSGSGTLALVEFEVLGTSGMTSTLHLADMTLNDGAIPTQVSDGSFIVSTVHRISGSVHHWNGNVGVPGVQLTLAGDRLYSGLSGSEGAYDIGGAPADAYTLTPSKADEVNGISAYDASLALRHAAGLSALSGQAAVAADVDKSGAITAMDAFYILQKAVELLALPFPGAGVVWDFDPRTRTYANLSSDQANQDFTAILLGDASGNWSTGGGLGLDTRSSVAATLALAQVTASPGAPVSVPLSLSLTEGVMYSADVALSYDPTVATALRVEHGALAEGWSLASNLSTPGLARVALAGATPITSGGQLLLFVFEAIGEDGSEAALALSRGALNEGAIPATLQEGRLSVQGHSTAQLALIPGWNLISLPLAPESTAITQALASIAGRYDLAYAYDTGSWKKFPNTAAPAFLNTLKVVSETQGLWIRANAPVSLTITGTLPANPALSLKQGWNLVGYPSQTTRPLTVALASIAGQYDLVYAYDAASATPWKKYNVSAPAFLNTLKEMGPGWGYWIRAKEECTWMVP